MPAMSFASFRNVRLGGSVRLALVFTVLGTGVAALVTPGSSWEQGKDALLYLVFVAALAGSAALILQGVLSMFRWALDGFDAEGRSYFTRSVALLAFIGTVGLVVALFREEISAPYPTSDGCWYSLRDRLTGDVEVKRTACPGEWNRKWDRARFQSLAS